MLYIWQLQFGQLVSSMKKNMASVEAHLKVVTRPSLYTAESAGVAAEKTASILGSLESDGPSAKIKRTWLLSLALIVFVGGISYWAYVSAIFEKTWTIPAWVQTALNISKEPIPATHPPAQQVVAKLDSPVEAKAAGPQAATIITESAPPSATEVAEAKTETTSAATAANTESMEKKGVEQHVAAAAAADVKTANVQKPAAKESPVHKNASTRKSDDVKVATAVPAPKHASANTSKNGKDGDVDLIAALLARVSPHEASGKESKHKKATASASHPNTDAKSQVASNRDIVTRSDGDTTESLLKRCKSLGFFEGELCRIRICSSLWGKDPACPAPEQSASINPN
jgi:hypothetical protein